MNILGAPYPIVKTPLGFLPTQTGIDVVKGDMLMLLLTNPGERVMMTNYGTPLRASFFEPNDTIVTSQLRATIWNAISMWEPRISIKDIQVANSAPSNDINSQDTQSEHIIGVTISFFDPMNQQDVQDLVLEVPLNQSGA
jgi:phage baseplate assembly protein W